MYISDKNMLAEMQLLKDTGRIRFLKEAYEVIGWDKSRINQIKNQSNYKQSYHFSAEDIRIFCKHFGVDANKILGLPTFSTSTLRSTSVIKSQEHTGI